uniref:Uncharacterized protein n=1 Tax=Florenciella sp. virus SA2 TaxID=3240092 RepID=A0AB39J848_9VIRU
MQKEPNTLQQNLKGEPYYAGTNTYELINQYIHTDEFQNVTRKISNMINSSVVPNKNGQTPAIDNKGQMYYWSNDRESVRADLPIDYDQSQTSAPTLDTTPAPIQKKNPAVSASVSVLTEEPNNPPAPATGNPALPFSATNLETGRTNLKNTPSAEAAAAAEEAEGIPRGFTANNLVNEKAKLKKVAKENNPNVIKQTGQETQKGLLTDPSAIRMLNNAKKIASRRAAIAGDKNETNGFNTENED